MAETEQQSHPALTEITRADGTTAQGLRKTAVVADRAKAVNSDTRTVSVVLSTEDVDRDGDVILQAGWDLRAYQRNPVVLAFHDPSKPIARGENVRVEGGRLVGDMVFPEKGEVALADEIFALYEMGALNAVSVGFMPEDLEPRRTEAGGFTGFDIRAAELYEFSAVSIPSNREALVRAKGATPLREVRDCLDRVLQKSADDDLRATFTIIAGEPHESQKAELAESNGLTKEQPGDTVSTSSDEGHAHDVVVGESMTEPAGDPEHVHAVTVDDDGEMTIETNEGHEHEVAATVDDPEEEGDTDGGEAEVEGAASADVPEGNPNAMRAASEEAAKAIVEQAEGLLAEIAEKSEAVQADLARIKAPAPSAEAAALKADWPELAWLADVEPKTDEAREKWRGVVETEKAKVIAERDKAFSIKITGEPEPVEKTGITLNAETAKLIAETVGKAVATEFRQLSGRV